MASKSRDTFAIFSGLILFPLENCRASIVELNIFHEGTYYSANNTLQSTANKEPDTACFFSSSESRGDNSVLCTVRIPSGGYPEIVLRINTQVFPRGPTCLNPSLSNIPGVPNQRNSATIDIFLETTG